MLRLDRVMATPLNALDPSRIPALVAWLEEQQRLSRDEIAHLRAEIDRLSLHQQEQGTQIAENRTLSEGTRNSIGRIPVVDGSLRDVREQVADLLQRIDVLSQQISHLVALRSAEAEREQKQVSALSQVVSGLEREDQVAQARVRILAEEIRRDRSTTAEVPKTIEDLYSRITSVTSRAEQIEEFSRRTESLANAHHEELEVIRAESAKLHQWRQLVELRWTRQEAEWQQVVDNWRLIAEESARPVHHLSSQVGQARDEIRMALGAIGDHQRRLDETMSVMSRTESILSQHREMLARLEMTLDSQRRRFDEQASAQLRLDESLGRSAEHRHEFMQAIDAHTRLIDELRSSVRADAEDLDRLRDDIQQVVTSLRQDIDSGRSLASNEIQRVDSVDRIVETRLLELGRVTHEHRQRMATEIEQQARELSDLISRFRPT